VLHVVRGEELALLDVHRLALAARLDEIGLAAQEGRRLQHIDHRGDGGDLLDRSCTSVSTGTPSCFFTSARISRPFSMPRPRKDLPELRLALS
jgi:hypothetical protein